MTTSSKAGGQAKCPIRSYPRLPKVRIPKAKQWCRKLKYVRIPVEDIRAASLRNALKLCQRFLPYGEVYDDYYYVTPAEDPFLDLDINLRTGEWVNERTVDEGSDIISLFAWLFFDSYAEAAVALALVLAFSAEVGDNESSPIDDETPGNE